ncbi:hypothetical protein OA5_06000 [Vibrio cyclitrophicus 1F111]|nr:hypothetical protein OA5_06000 [Vibrio cyclitrophicus 1F111]
MTFPGKYYLTSRYNSNPMSFLIYLAKYWGSIIIFYGIIVEHQLVDSSLLYFFSLLLYFSIYDYFCCINDQEPEALTKRSGDFVSINITLLHSLLISCLGFLFFGVNFLYPILTCFMLSVVFFFHNRFSDKNRVLTYFALYFIKPFLFFQHANDLSAVTIFSALYAFSYVPYYLVKKFNINWPNKLVKLLCSGIFLKCLFLIFFIPFSTEIFYLLIWQILLTVVDFFNKKHSQTISI